MTRTAFIAYFAWALLQCAPVNAGPAASDSPSPATTNTQPRAPGADHTRLSRLARRMADDGPGDQTGETGDTSTANRGKTQGTPLVATTPLLRPGVTGEPPGDADERPGSMPWFLKTLTALGLVIGLALLVRWVYVRLGGTTAAGSSPVVEVLSRTSVAPRSHVMLLRVGGRVLVVSESSAGMQPLASVDDPQEVADILGAVSAARPNSISKGFGQFLNRFNEDHDQQPQGLGPADADPQRTGRPRDTVSGLLSRVRAMGRQGGSP